MKYDLSKIYIVIPAFNEEKVICDTINEVYNAGYDNIIIVDDGSTDDTYEKSKSFSKNKNITVLKHKINRGKGAATKTGIEAAKLLDAGIIVTMDADGQHDPKDIPVLINPLKKQEVDVTLGSRLLKHPKGMPWYKIVYNKIGNIITWYLFGLYVSDSQSGMRAYSLYAANLIDTRYDRYEYESEVIHEIRHHNLKYKEVPITVRYTEYSMNKPQKQSFINGLKTVYKMVFKLIH